MKDKNNVSTDIQVILDDTHTNKKLDENKNTVIVKQIGKNINTD